MSDRLSDEQVAWYAGTSRTAKWTADMSPRRDIIALAREVQELRMANEALVKSNDAHYLKCQELRAEVERLTAENRMLGESGADNRARWRGERALADQLAEALVYQRDMIGSGMDKAMLRNVRLSLEAWKAARHEGQP